MTSNTAWFLVSTRVEMPWRQRNWRPSHLIRLVENSHPVLRCHQLVPDIAGPAFGHAEIHQVDHAPSAPDALARELLLMIGAFVLRIDEVREAYFISPPPERWPVAEDTGRPHLEVRATLGIVSPEVHWQCVEAVRDYVRIGVIQLDPRSLFETHGGLAELVALGIDVEHFVPVGLGGEQ